MNAPWMNTAGSRVPETSYSRSAPSRLAFSNHCLPLGTPAASGECCRSLLFGPILHAATPSVARVCADRRLYFTVRLSIIDRSGETFTSTLPLPSAHPESSPRRAFINVLQRTELPQGTHQGGPERSLLGQGRTPNLPGRRRKVRLAHVIRAGASQKATQPSFEAIAGSAKDKPVVCSVSEVLKATISLVRSSSGR